MQWPRRRVRAPGRHVLVLSWRDVWHPQSGGSERYVQHVVEGLRDAGHRVTVVCSRYPGAAARETRAGIHYVRRGSELTVYLWAALLAVTGRLGRVDRVLEVQNGVPFLSRLYAPRRVTLLVHHVHREQWPDLGRVLATVGWWLESQVAVRVNRGCRYITVSDVTREELVALGVRRRDISVARNGRPAPPPYAHARASTTPRLVVLSRLVPHKQIEHALVCLARLLPEVPGLHLVVIGSGWWEPQLRRRAEELGVTEQVRFTGHVTDEQKFQELERSWLHLLPSVKEGWGISVIEAALVGVPTIAYRSAGGVTESVNDGVTGLLAEDLPDLVDRTRVLLDDPVLRQSLSEKGRIWAERHTWEDTTARVRQTLGT